MLSGLTRTLTLILPAESVAKWCSDEVLSEEEEAMEHKE